MAYINVAEWNPDQVTDWLKGLDDSMYAYVVSFTNNQVGGRQLLNIRPYELEQLSMHSIGHQEIVLEAVENLRNFHYNLDKDNLQFMALHVATAARSLHRQLAIHCDASKIETQMLNDITRTIGTIKPLISWLERSPFHGLQQFKEICGTMLRLGLEMATIAHRDRFVERPVEQIRGTAEKLERLANYIIQDITDPMLLQPASLNLVTLKKRESELGFNIESNYHGIHRVTDIKYNSPAHNSGKIEDGDEIVQINYQTVVGWRYKTVLVQLHESLPDMVLTLKKRPKHTKIYGQIYMQPYRLPSKKRAIRWGENLTSTRTTLLTVPDVDFNVPHSLKGDNEKTTAATASSDEDSSCSDVMTPTDTKPMAKEIRLYYPKPRALLQRRNTICGDDLQSLKCVGGLPIWHDRKTGADGDPASPSLRDKSHSFGFGLEIAPRRITCSGIADGASKFISDVFCESKKLKQVPEILTEEPELIASKSTHSKPGVSKVVRFDADMKVEDYLVDEKYTCNVQNTILQTFEPILYADEEEDDVLDTLHNASEESADILQALNKASKIGGDTSLVEAINIPIVGRRGRLDKSHSTPAYDNSGEESDPPAIEPRKELQTPPVPPPRPRKSKEMQPLPPAIPPPPLITPALTEAKTQSFPIQNLNQTLPTIQSEASELHTPIKARTLTLKKKHSLVAKRRNINLKLLGTGEIQGHLYRRTKDRRGVTFWARLYFVMLDTILYGFRTKEAPKASCVIFLPGFTVSLAKEVHSKPFAFKVYHSAKTFYFAAESQDALNQWVEFIGQATIHLTTITNSISGSNSTKHLFSETDSSGEESELMVLKNLCTPSPQGQGSKDSVNATSSTATKHDRRYLGSLRKLTKGSLPFKSSSNADKKPSSDIPVPTDQYRSFRKVPGGSCGIQIGTNTPGYHNALPLSLSFAATPAECLAPQRKHSLSNISNSLDFTSSMCLGPPSSPAPPLNINSNTASTLPPTITNTCSTRDNSFESPTKGIKKNPHNFIHASNPNLVEFDFQTSKNLDYSLPKINPSIVNNQNIEGVRTLKDLMLQKQEEEAQEMYNNRVLLGVEKKDALRRAEYFRQQEECVMGNDQKQQQIQQTQQSGAGKVSQTQCRSLPRTPDYEISFKPDDENIRRTRTKEGLKLRDFGYELISGDEPIGGVVENASRQNSSNSVSSVEHQHEHGWTAAMKTRNFLKSQQFLLSTHKGKKHSSNSCSSTSSADFGEKRPDSFRKKGKLEAFKTSSERIFQFNKHTERSGMTMTLPLNKKGDGGSCGRIKKSHTYNNDLKENAGGKYDAHRKNSAPMPIFSKLSFSSASGNSNNNNNNNKTPKEKRLLGSPLLHRTIFGIQQPVPVATNYKEREYDTEIFSQVTLPKVPKSRNNEYNGSKHRNLSLTNANITAPDAVAPPPPISTATQIPTPPHSHDECETANQSVPNASNEVATPEYPNMECPPVFEPEIYSLTDPKASKHLLLRRNNSGSIAEEKQ